MSFPTKAERQTCWDSRDRYWDCLDANASDQQVCAKLRQLYETSCPGQWVKHFDRKKNYLKFKERIEKEGYEPLPKIPPPNTSPVGPQTCGGLPIVVPRARRQHHYRPISWIN